MTAEIYFRWHHGGGKGVRNKRAGMDFKDAIRALVSGGIIGPTELK
jgi:hypothetical protein